AVGALCRIGGLVRLRRGVEVALAAVFLEGAGHAASSTGLAARTAGALALGLGRLVGLVRLVLAGGPGTAAAQAAAQQFGEVDHLGTGRPLLRLGVGDRLDVPGVGLFLDQRHDLFLEAVGVRLRIPVLAHFLD